jgi:hypothetical protein
MQNIDTRTIAANAREFARMNRIPVGTRGRISADLFTEYLMSKPRTAREVAAALRIPVSARGRISKTVANEMGLVLAGNKS